VSSDSDSELDELDELDEFVDGGVIVDSNTDRATENAVGVRLLINCLSKEDFISKKKKKKKKKKETVSFFSFSFSFLFLPFECVYGDDNERVVAAARRRRDAAVGRRRGAICQIDV
jgi:hypothetical protein